MSRFLRTAVKLPLDAAASRLRHNQRPNGCLGAASSMTFPQNPMKFYSTEEKPAFIEGTEEDASSVGADSNPASSSSKPMMIWFNGLFPISSSLFDPRGFLSKSFVEQMKTTLYSSLLPPPSQQPFPFIVAKTIPNIKEGEYPWTLQSDNKGGMYMLLKESTPDFDKKKVVESIEKYLDEQNYRSQFFLRKVRVFHVKGTPFMEDMVGRSPSGQLRIEFEGPDLSPEVLYRHLRKYGRIIDISLQSLSSKESPRHAIVQFAWKSNASAAKNCAHGQKIESTRLSISYEKRLGILGTVLKWSSDHPRIMIPLLIGLLGGLTYLIFDPIRVWFIGNTIQSNTSVSKWRDVFYEWVLGLAQYSSLVNIFIPKKDQNIGWQDYIDEEHRLLSALHEHPESMYLISGPRASGKSDLVRNVHQKLPYYLVIDCEELINIPEHEMLSRLATQIGFYPQLNFIVSASGVIDTLIAATTGAKSGFTTSYEAQVKKMLELLGLAVTRIAVKQHSQRTLKSTPDPEISTDVQYPVIFIKGFMSRERARNDYIYTLLAQFASQIVENRLAHVVFVSSNPVMPSKPIETINLHDATFENSVNYVKERLESVDNETNEYIRTLGGRRTDLELFIQKIKAGSSSAEAFNDIIYKSVSELRKIGLGEGDIRNETKCPWDPIQFWILIDLLSKNDSVCYDELKQYNLFKGNEAPLQEMENYGLIHIEQENGHPKFVRCGRPIYKEAFKSLTSDVKLCATMNIKTAKAQRKDEEAKLFRNETEMQTLSNILSAGTDGRVLSTTTKKKICDRINFLAGLVDESHQKIVVYDQKERVNKKLVKLKI